MNVRLFFITGFLTITFLSYSQQSIPIDDLKLIVGEWTGTITYLDYQTNEPFTMPANLIVEHGKKEGILILNNIYPNEPKANNTEKIKLTNDGTVLNNIPIASREKTDDGQVRIQAQHEAKDDNKNALIRYTYLIGSDQFVIRKEVQFDESTAWIKRSEFNYQKK